MRFLFFLALKNTKIRRVFIQKTKKKPEYNLKVDIFCLRLFLKYDLIPLFPYLSLSHIYIYIYV